jgi:hypothetical protein
LPYNRELYRGRKTRRSWPRVLLIILLALTVIAVLLFYGLQKYIVYTPNGVKLELPILASASPDGGSGTSAPQASAGLVIDKTDYSNITATAGDGLSAVKAIYVPASDITPDGINKYAERLSKGNALVMELKPASGQLAWKSSVKEASSYALNGTADLSSVISGLKEKKVWLVAELSCCVDTLMAQRNTPAALKTAAGGAYADAEGGWIDPYSAEMRQYIVDLSNELISMGFDEILLTNVCHPEVEPSALGYSASRSTDATAESVVAGYALYVTRSLAGTNAVVSVVGTRDAISGAQGSKNGQNIGLLLKIFDRVYCYTDAQAYSEYMNDCKQYVTIGDVNTRFVPMCSGDLPGTDCWVLLDGAK